MPNEDDDAILVDMIHNEIQAKYPVIRCEEDGGKDGDDEYEFRAAREEVRFFNSSTSTSSSSYSESDEVNSSSTQPADEGDKLDLYKDLCHQLTTKVNKQKAKIKTLENELAKEKSLRQGGQDIQKVWCKRRKRDA